MSRPTVVRLLVVMLASFPAAAAAQALSATEQATIESEVKARFEKLIDTYRTLNVDAMMTYYLGDAAKEYGGWVAYDGTLTRAEEFTPKAMEDLRRNWATLARQNIEVQKLVVHALTPNLAIAAFSGRNSLTDKAGKTTDWSLSVMTALWVKHEGAWRIAEQHQSFQPAPK